ncbi:hypothetical protein, partial [uncultured Subdoligranulum sp.]|uniref:hypothetical protein n=1 Tax=uncultured Subdoligranulum sp. TaxID=512298 RepID=UPI0025D106EF
REHRLSTPFFNFFDKFFGLFLVIRYSVIFCVFYCKEGRKAPLLQFASYYNSIKASYRKEVEP